MRLEICVSYKLSRDSSGARGPHSEQHKPGSEAGSSQRALGVLSEGFQALSKLTDIFSLVRTAQHPVRWSDRILISM